MRIEEEPRLAEGIRLFNEGRFFEAHEVLEDLWRVISGPERALLLGLIQVCVAHLHAERDNLHGVKTLVASARRHLEPFPSRSHGIDLERIRRDLDRLRPRSEAPVPRDLPRIVFDAPTPEERR